MEKRLSEKDASDNSDYDKLAKNNNGERGCLQNLKNMLTCEKYSLWGHTEHDVQGGYYQLLMIPSFYCTAAATKTVPFSSTEFDKLCIFYIDVFGNRCNNLY